MLKGGCFMLKNHKVCLPQTCPSLILKVTLGLDSSWWESLTWTQLICFRDEKCGLWWQADLFMPPDSPLAAHVALENYFPRGFVGE